MLRSISSSPWRFRFGPLLINHAPHTSISGTPPRRCISTSPHRSVKSSDWAKIGFLTDVEGNLDFWMRYVERSEVLYPDPSGARDEFGHPLLCLRDSCGFVHGGDVFDNGPGDFPVARALVSLKQRYPDRVALILGNRDVNKMRLSSELAPSYVSSQNLPEVPGPYWVPEHRRGNVLAWTKRNFPDTPEEELEIHNDPIQRLRWILEETMGAATTFERRRSYLRVKRLYDWCVEYIGVSNLEPLGISLHSILRASLSETADGDYLSELCDRLRSAGYSGVPIRTLEDIEITDLEVYASFMNSVTPRQMTAEPGWQSYVTSAAQTSGKEALYIDPESRGAVLDYLSVAQLALIVGDTLFVHGGLKPQVLGALPLSALGEPGTDGRRSKCKPFVEGHLEYAEMSELPEFQGSSWKLQDWTDRVNDWARQQVSEWIQHPEVTRDLQFRGGEDLMRYCTKTGSNARGFIYESHARSGHPEPIPEEVRDFLKAQGIRRLLLGHQPLGDTPTVVKSPHLELIMADTAFSDTTAPDNRGIAVSEVLVHQRPELWPEQQQGRWGLSAAAFRNTEPNSGGMEMDGPESWVSVHGVMKDGMPSSYTLTPYPEDWPEFPDIYHVHQTVPEDQLRPYQEYLRLVQTPDQSMAPERIAELLHTLEAVGDIFIGRQTFDGWLVKSRVIIPSPPNTLPLLAYNLFRGKGFQVEYRPIVLPELWFMPFVAEPLPPGSFQSIVKPQPAAPPG